MSARTDLSGGYQATGIPTGIHLQRARPTSIPASPVRAIALPDNWLEVEDERALRERSSDPLGLESCAATAILYCFALLIFILSPMVVLRTPTDIFPDINIPVIAIAWTYTGLNPEEMEGRITSVYERSSKDLSAGHSSDGQIGRLVFVHNSKWQTAAARKLITRRHIAKSDRR